MNSDITEGTWKKLKGKVLQEYGELTEDDVTAAKGRRSELAGKLQSKYGMKKEEAQEKIDELLAKVS